LGGMKGTKGERLVGAFGVTVLGGQTELSFCGFGFLPAAYAGVLRQVRFARHRFASAEASGRSPGCVHVPPGKRLGNFLRCQRRGQAGQHAAAAAVRALARGRIGYAPGASCRRNA
jgi:hypothetical protein